MLVLISLVVWCAGRMVSSRNVLKSWVSVVLIRKYPSYYSAFLWLVVRSIWVRRVSWSDVVCRSCMIQVDILSPVSAVEAQTRSSVLPFACVGSSTEEVRVRFYWEVQYVNCSASSEGWLADSCHSSCFKLKSPARIVQWSLCHEWERSVWTVSPSFADPGGAL